MKRSYILLMIGGLLATLPALAQQDLYYWRAGVQVGSMTYYGDLNSKVLPGELTPDQLAWGVSVERLVGEDLSAKLLYSQGQFRVNDRTDDKFLARSLNAQTNIRDYSVLFTYYLDNDRFLERKSFIAPYLSLGLGYTSFNVYGDLLDETGELYHYWSDNTIRSVAEDSPDADQAEIVAQDGSYETELTPLATEQAYDTETFNIPLALGLKFRLGDRLNLNLEVMGRFTFTDYLDDVSGNYRTEYDNNLQRVAANPTGREAAQRGSSPSFNDLYTFTSVSLHYNFSRRNYVYRAPKIYATGDNAYWYPDPTPARSSRTVPVPDTIATQGVSRNVLFQQGYTLSDSLRVVPSTVGQDTFLTVVQSRLDTLTTQPVATDTLAEVILPTTLSNVTSLVPLTDSLAIAYAPDSLRRDSLLYMVRYAPDSLGERQVVDTVATLSTTDTLTTLSDSSALSLSSKTVGADRILRLVRLDTVRSASRTDTLASIRVSDTTTTIPLSDSLTLSLGSEAARVVSRSTTRLASLDTTTSALPAASNFDPRPIAATDTTVAVTNETTRLQQEVARLRQELQQLKNASQTGRASSSVARRVSESPPAAANEPTAPPEARTVAADTLGEATESVAPSIAGTLKAAPETDETKVVPRSATTDTLYRDSLNQRMDSFSQYLQSVSQKNDTSLVSVMQEVQALRRQLSNIQDNRQATSIGQQLRTIELEELRSSEVYFDFASDRVSPTAQERLQQTASFLKAHPDVVVRLRGFTDATGDPERNQLLSRRRAKAVSDLLVAEGVDPERISVRFFGADLSLDRSEASYARRVEVILEE